VAVCLLQKSPQAAATQAQSNSGASATCSLPAIAPWHMPHIVALHALQYNTMCLGKKIQGIAKDTRFSSSFPFLSSNVHTMVKFNGLIGVPNKNV